MAAKALTAKQTCFVEEYLVDFNGTQAAIRAGYSARSAKEIASENLTKPHLLAALAEAQKALTIKATVTADDVLAELEAIGFANMLDYMQAGPDKDPYLDFSKLTRKQAAALQEVTVEDYKDGRGEDARDVRKIKFKLQPKLPALIKLGDRFGLWDHAAAPEGAKPGKKAQAEADAKTAGDGTEWGNDLDLVTRQ
jgi:phage terminase small subunit